MPLRRLRPWPNQVQPRGGGGSAPVSSQPQGYNQAGAPEPPAKPDLEITVNNINDFVQSIQRSIHFSVSEATGRTIIKVYDAETEELIREIPSEEIQRIAEVIAEQLENGILVDTNI
mgnify:CR=1 FL=1